VEALGVLALPAPSPPLPVAALFAKPRSPATWLSTLPLLFVSGAPAALAVAFEAEVDVVFAVKLTAPPTLIGRSVVAVALWFAKVSAAAAPIAAEPLEVVSPEAVVVAVAVVLAVNAALAALWVGPGFCCAVAFALLI